MRRSCHERKGEKGRCKGLIKRRAAAAFLRPGTSDEMT